MELIKVLKKPTTIKPGTWPPEITEFGHAAIQTPNQTKGLWPKTEADKNNPNDFGRVHDDSNEKFKCDEKYDACPESVKVMDAWINKMSSIINADKNPFGGNPEETYMGLNAKKGRNCIGFAYSGIEATGGKPPYPSTTTPLPCSCN